MLSEHVETLLQSMTSLISLMSNEVKSSKNYVEAYFQFKFLTVNEQVD